MDVQELAREELARELEDLNISLKSIEACPTRIGKFHQLRFLLEDYHEEQTALGK